MSAEESGSQLGWLRRIYDRLNLLGIKGVDQANEASYDNPVPVSMPSMAAVTALTTPDTSSYGNDGTLLGATPPQLVPSPFGTAFSNAFRFDGSSGSVISAGNGVSGPLRISGVGTAAKFNLRIRIRTPLVMSAVFSGIAGRASDASSVGGCQPTIFYDGAGGILTIVRDNTGTARVLAAPSSLAVDTNYEIQFDYDGVTERLFINGALAASGALSGVEAGNATDRFIFGGYDVAGTTGPFTGIICDMQWSNTSRHVAAFTPSALPAVSDGNTLGLWPCDQTFGTISVDTELPAAVALSDTAANPTAPAVGAFTMFWDVVQWRRWFGALVADGFGAVYAPFVNAFVHMRDAAGARVELRGDSTGVWVGSQSVVKQTVTASASGDTIVRTPTGTNKIRLYFFGYSAGANITGNLVGLKLAGYNSGAVFDQQYLIAAGQPYARNIMGGKKYIEGSAGGVLTVNLSAAQTVYVNYEIEEVP